MRYRQQFERDTHTLLRVVACIVTRAAMYGALSLLVSPLIPRPVAGQARAGVPVPASADGYRGYTVPQCLAASRRIERIILRARDTVSDQQYPPEWIERRDTVQRCLAMGRWTAASVDPRLLPMFYELSVTANDTAAALASMTRLLSLQKTADDSVAKLMMMAIVVDGPLRIVWPVLNAITTRLHAMASPNAAQLLAHVYGAAAQYGMAAGFMDDRTALQYLDSMEITAARAPLDSVPVIRRMAAEYRAQLAVITDDITGPQGQPLTVPPLPGTVILGPPSPYPVPGKVTLIVFLDIANGVFDPPMLQRLQHKFGDALQIVLVANARQSFGLLAPLSFADESRYLHDYFADSVKVDFPVLLESMPITRRPDPDGRAVFHPSVVQQTYPGFTCLLVDRRGVARAGLTGWWMTAERRLSDRITKLLPESSSTH